MLVSVSLGMFSHDMKAGWRSWWEQAARVPPLQSFHGFNWLKPSQSGPAGQGKGTKKRSPRKAEFFITRSRVTTKVHLCLVKV